MSLQLHCYEPDARPPRATFPSAPGGGASLYLLLGASGRNLRNLVLRGKGEDAPPEALRVCDVDVYRTPQRAPAARVRALSPQIELSIFRGDARAKVISDAEIRSLTRFEIVLSDGRTLPFSLDVTAPTEQGARQTVGSGRTRSLDERSEDLRSLWVVPKVWQALEDPRTRVTAAVQAATPGWVNSRGFAVAMSFLTLAVLGVWAEWRGTSRVKAAEAVTAEAKEAQAAAEANLRAALAAESTCSADRRRLAMRLADADADRAARVDRALGFARSRARAIERGGERVRTADALGWDEAAADGVRRAVLAEMAALETGAPPDVEACLDQDARLGEDLPRYALLWHGDPESVCPADYTAIAEGVDRAGRWGISRRAADAFGDAIPDAARPFGTAAPAEIHDLRLTDPWSAGALGDGLRAAEDAILDADTGARPAAAPGQTQLWALALWSAYNRMPVSPGGALDEPLERCVSELLDELEAAAPSPRPGEPVLPDIAEVAGDRRVPVTPTAGCPWPARALERGAQDAIRAAARAAWVDPLAAAEPG